MRFVERLRILSGALVIVYAEAASSRTRDLPVKTARLIILLYLADRDAILAGKKRRRAHKNI
jgi:hypothetical protein